MNSELTPSVAKAAHWLDQMIATTPYGEVSITFRLHEGRTPIEERAVNVKLRHEPSKKPLLTSASKR